MFAHWGCFLTHLLHQRILENNKYPNSSYKSFDLIMYAVKELFL